MLNNPFKPAPPLQPQGDQQVGKKEEIASSEINVLKQAEEESKERNLKTMADLVAKEADALGDLASAEGLDKDQTDKIMASTKEPEPGKKDVEVRKTRASTKVAMESKTIDEIDLDKLDESTLLRYPIIAKSLTESAMVTIKPKTNTIIFRWVYFNNGMVRGNQDKVTATNVGRYRYMGFEFATVQDIEGGEDALIEGIIDDGGKIINYDTVLMKIDKLRLMGHYKQNLLDSVSRVDGALRRAAKSAENEVHQAPGFQKAMSTHPDAKIEFFEPR